MRSCAAGCAAVCLLLAAATGFQVAPRALRGVAARRGGSAVAASGSGSGEWDLKCFSPAKINLFLRIMGKRPDGFHELASLFQAIDLGDTLSFRVLPASSAADEFECDVEGVPTDSTNLVLRALAVYRQRVGGDLPRFRVRLEKDTPVQAGLGGGSSNAATALWAANELSGRKASAADLELWSGELGSDVTFFLGPSGTAYCTGRGELVEGVEPLESDARAIFVVKPAVGLSTPLVFGTLAKSNYATLAVDRDPKQLLAAFASPAGAGPGDYVNDLEAPAFECLPELEKIKGMLLADKFAFSSAMMSGSGTSLFAVADDATLVDLEAFPALFEKECLDTLGVAVRVWRTNFMRRNPEGWYDFPGA
ncbi:ribosomal protein S5 domain 2-type protein [Pelagophyceae sp. CCMP2097]|nr:ribosomal protein S5 domain 2-type protein [Pelagophyceae sp. CCMP2097]